MNKLNSHSAFITKISEQIQLACGLPVLKHQEMLISWQQLMQICALRLD